VCSSIISVDYGCTYLTLDVGIACTKEIPQTKHNNHVFYKRYKICTFGIICEKYISELREKLYRVRSKIYVELYKIS